ncbi:MAG: GNAT family N-acetyltransferase [Pseudoxanthomonas sp.]
MTCTIRQITADEARQFWQQQADARIFLHPDVLESMCERVDWWLGEWNTHPACLWPVCRAFGGSHRPPALSAYVGPLWHDSVGASKAHRWWTITAGVQDAMIAFLAERYDDFMFELPPGTADIRVFQWFQAEHVATHEVFIQPRHTTCMDRPQRFDAGSIAAVFGRDRKRDVRVAMDHPYRECSDASAEEIADLYVQLLDGKANGEEGQRRRREILALADAVNRGFGSLLACRDTDGTLASYSLTMGKGGTVVAPVTASSESARRHRLQAWVRLHAVARAFEQGAHCFDFTGGNSRIGAEDMHRYGTLPAMYFRIRVARR